MNNAKAGTFAAGWNARVANLPSNAAETKDWIDGWVRCDKVRPADRKPFNQGMVSP